MQTITPQIMALIAALGIGFLIGVVRERQKHAGDDRAPGGIRTFTLVALLGALCQMFGNPYILVAALALVGTFAIMSNFQARDKESSISADIAIVLTLLLGALSVTDAQLAVALAVITAVLLASKNILHVFARDQLSEYEVRDALIFAAAALVVWPILPDKPLDPLGALNLKSIWALVVLVMAVGSFGHIGTRILGEKLGLPFVGFASGFASSTATIMSMGTLSRDTPKNLNPAVTGAAFSSVSTFIQLGIILIAISVPMAIAMWPILFVGGATAILYGALFMRRVLADGDVAEQVEARVFDLRAALMLAVLVSVVLIITVLLNNKFGSSGVLVGTAVSGLADTHAPAAAIASLVSTEQITSVDGRIPIVAAITTNTVSKLVAALGSNNKAFIWRVAPGLILIVIAVWLTVFLT